MQKDKASTSGSLVSSILRILRFWISRVFDYSSKSLSLDPRTLTILCS